MNSVLSEIIETGNTRTANENETVKLHSAITFEEGFFLQELVRQSDPTVSLEVGLAHGVSALFICDALNVREGTQHIAIDPDHRTGSWAGGGIANLHRAGYGNIVRLIEEPSYRALPALERAGQRIDFAFIDGWHTFDFALVDFFFIDRMLNVGGVVAFDDANWPAIRKVCRFVKTSMSYSVLGSVGEVQKESLKRRLASNLLRHSPASVLLRPEIIGLDTGIMGRCVAFRKEANDSRSWDHFADF